MKILKTKEELSNTIALLKEQGKKIGFVPTMGALHEGHLQLVRRAVDENELCFVSVFVNPTQFNNADDLKKYPRDLERDASLLEGAGAYLLFAPEADDIYQSEELEHCFDFDFGGLDKVMEGKFRPGHFNGVVQIVSKLFELVQPDKAYFGEKDFQQLAIIHRMTKLMNFPVQIVDCPIVREPSGLAMSSRNERLTSEQRKKAAEISKILFESCNFVPQKSPRELESWISQSIDSVDGLQLEYCEIVDVVSLQQLNDWSEKAVVCVAVFCGDVRLIDNLRYPNIHPAK